MLISLGTSASCAAHINKMFWINLSSNAYNNLLPVLVLIFLTCYLFKSLINDLVSHPRRMDSSASEGENLQACTAASLSVSCILQQSDTHRKMRNQVFWDVMLCHWMSCS